MISKNFIWFPLEEIFRGMNRRQWKGVKKSERLERGCLVHSLCKENCCIMETCTNILCKTLWIALHKKKKRQDKKSRKIKANNSKKEFQVWRLGFKTTLFTFTNYLVLDQPSDSSKSNSVIYSVGIIISLSSLSCRILWKSRRRMRG